MDGDRPDTKETKVDALFYRVGFDGIARAYRSSINAFDAEESRIAADWDAHQRAVSAGEAVTVVEDESSGSHFDFGAHTGDLLYEVEEGKRHIREAFAIVLYHHWEKKVCELLTVKTYKQDNAFVAARAAGWSPDENTINKLRIVANCVKHDSTEAQKLDALDDTFFDKTEIPNGWYEALRLSDAHMDLFISALRLSGPPLKGWLSKP